MDIKVGFLVSADYDYLFNSIPLVYEEASMIALAIDKNRRTWSGNSYTLPDTFFQWLKRIDIQKKIRVYEDDFYIPDLSSIENDTRERNMLAKFMGSGGWHIQIDSDEYFLEFKKFVKFLRANGHLLAHPEKTPVEFTCFLSVMYKKTASGFLITTDKNDLCTVATNNPVYVAARNSNNRRIYIPFIVLHQTWAREKEEVEFKFRNWGHNKDFNIDAYFNTWKSVDETNYHKYKNLHPLSKRMWKSLFYCEGKSVPDLIDNLEKMHKLTPPYFKIKVLNSFLYRYFKKIKNKFKIAYGIYH